MPPKTLPPAPSKLRAVWLSLGVFFLLIYGWTFIAISAPNERSRIYLSVALIDHHTLSIDPSIARFGPIMDIARHRGVHYSDKAPGSGMIGALVYGAVRVWSEPEDWTIEDLLELMRTWVMVPLGLAGFWVMRRVLYLLGVPDDQAWMGSLAWVCGSAAFYYSTAFYGHQIVAVCLLLGLWQVLEAEQGGRRPAWRFFAAGLAAGLAGLTEYQAGVPCVMLAAFACAGPKRSWATGAAFVAGALPLLYIFFAYHQAAFGGPLELSYHHLVVSHLASLHTEGVGGVGWPQVGRWVPLMWSQHRGLIATSPIFALTPLGAWWLWQARRRRLGALVGGVGVFYVGLAMGTRAWEGGWSFGPRLLVPAMAWMMVGVGWGVWRVSQKSPWAFGLCKGAIAGGLLLHQGMHLYLSEFDPTVENPVVDMLWPALSAGLVAPNLGQKWLGLAPMESIWPPVVVTLALMVWVGSVGVARRPWRAWVPHVVGLVVLPCLMWGGMWWRGETIPERDREAFFGYTRQWQATEARRQEAMRSTASPE